MAARTLENVGGRERPRGVAAACLGGRCTHVRRGGGAATADRRDGTGRVTTGLKCDVMSPVTSMQLATVRVGSVRFGFGGRCCRSQVAH